MSDVSDSSTAATPLPPLESLPQGLIDQGQQWLQRLLELCGLPAQVEGRWAEALGDSSGEPEPVIWLAIAAETLDSQQQDILLGNGATVLDSIQYLASLLLNLHQPRDAQFPYVVDLNDYRQRRQAELQAMADAAVAQVRQSGQNYELPGLSSAERRQIHHLLKGFEDIETHSHGKEPDRRLVVTLSRV